MTEQIPGTPGEAGSASGTPSPSSESPTTRMAAPTPTAPTTPPPTTPVSGSTSGAGGGGSRTTLIVAALIVAIAIIAGAYLISQGFGASSSPTPAPSAAATDTPAPTGAPTPTAAPTATPDPCAPGSLATLTAGTLTIGADNPAYPPYFAPSDTNPVPWEFGDPTNGQGFESAVAYAVAGQLGFAQGDVAWTVVPFNNSFAPGPKPFDFYITQVSYTPERATAVDLSDGYYVVNQSIVVMNGSPLVGVTSIAGLASYRFGAQVGTTSYDTIVERIKPTREPSVFDTNDAAIEALKNGQIDGIVVDLPTAFYITAAQIVDEDFNPLATIVGQFPAPAEGEHFSLVLAKDSPLTSCVNEAIASLEADGTLDAITKEWLSDKANAPEFTP